MKTFLGPEMATSVRVPFLGGWRGEDGIYTVGAQLAFQLYSSPPSWVQLKFQLYPYSIDSIPLSPVPPLPPTRIVEINRDLKSTYSIL